MVEGWGDENTHTKLAFDTVDTVLRAQISLGRYTAAHHVQRLDDGLERDAAHGVALARAEAPEVGRLEVREDAEDGVPQRLLAHDAHAVAVDEDRPPVERDPHPLQLEHVCAQRLALHLRHRAHVRMPHGNAGDVRRDAFEGDVARHCLEHRRGVDRGAVRVEDPQRVALPRLVPIRRDEEHDHKLGQRRADARALRGAFGGTAGVATGGARSAADLAGCLGDQARARPPR
eukprot:CAMPEP_0174843058 /NCGR_PEP_ID=MMETSP1114-20130205/10287_1 /TAXON_ID=312471 /ORGANISM="Neobodo designis, Strain CCAP 1951/1" /LENGTH=230 /DNA_ID=CAMNT_0016077271 /DNA_START=72 /DNA_END=761 /DNA_ORIENTATION=-